MILSWTGPSTILVVRPAAAADSPGRCLPASNLLYLDLSSNAQGPDARNRVSVLSCKRCITPTTPTISQSIFLRPCRLSSRTPSALSHRPSTSPWKISRPHPAVSTLTTSSATSLFEARVDILPWCTGHVGPVCSRRPRSARLAWSIVSGTSCSTGRRKLVNSAKGTALDMLFARKPRTEN